MTYETVGKSGEKKAETCPVEIMQLITGKHFKCNPCLTCYGQDFTIIIEYKSINYLTIVKLLYLKICITLSYHLLVSNQDNTY